MIKNGIIAAVVGFLMWLFKAHLLDLLAKLVGSLWHLATRHRLDEKDEVSFIIHRKAKIVDVQNFLRIQPRG